MDAKTKNIIAWIATAMVAYMMTKAGVLKLISHEVEVTRFIKWGFSDWFRYLIGGLEILGAIGLFIPKLRTPAIFGIIGLMIGAIYTHVVLDNNPTHIGGASAVILLGIVILMLRRSLGSER